jgi:hypothetical protein
MRDKEREKKDKISLVIPNSIFSGKTLQPQADVVPGDDNMTVWLVWNENGVQRKFSLLMRVWTRAKA